MDAAAFLVAEVTEAHDFLGDLFGGEVADGLAFDAPDGAFAADVLDRGQFVEFHEALLDRGTEPAALLKNIGLLEFIQRREDGGAAEGVAAPGVRPVAEAHAGKDVGASDDGIDGHAVAESLAEGDEVGLDPVFAVGIHRTGAPEVGLHFIEEKEQIVFLTEPRQHLHVFLLRVIRSASTEVGLGDEDAEAVAEFGLEGLELGAIGREIERLLARLEAAAFLLGEADETDAGIALLVGLAAGDGAREALLAVEAAAGREDDAVALGTFRESGPESLLHGLATARGPEDLLKPGSAGSGLEAGEETAARLELDLGDGVVRGQGHTHVESALAAGIL